MTDSTMQLPEGITDARKLMTSAKVSFDRSVDSELVLGLASHFAEWKYGTRLEYEGGGKVIAMNGGDGRQIRVGTYGIPSGRMYGGSVIMEAADEDYLFMGSDQDIWIHRHERVGGDGALDRYLEHITS
jgi:hypothetical protein